MVWENEDDRQKLINEARKEHQQDIKDIQEDYDNEPEYEEPDPLDEPEDTPCLDDPWWVYD
jgi:hypothetical protein